MKVGEFQIGRYHAIIRKNYAEGGRRRESLLYIFYRGGFFIECLFFGEKGRDS